MLVMIEMAENPNIELQAFQQLTELLQQAEKCKTLFESAHIALPEPLQRILKITVPTNGASEKAVVSLVPPPPEMQSKPPEAGPDWICVRVTDAMSTTVVLAILRNARGLPVRPRDIVGAASSLRVDVSIGVISNIGARLEKRGFIKRATLGWTLLTENGGPVLHNGWLWGPRAIFDPHDLAAHRRDAILHILRCHTTGLQMVQIVERLRNSPWHRAPISTDLIKADLDLLDKAGKIKRRGNTKKWEITPMKKQTGLGGES